MPADILRQFAFGQNKYPITAFGSGLINNTWLVEAAGKKYVLQRINQNVFKTPWDIDENIMLLSNYLQQNYPGYMITTPVSTVDHKTLIVDETGAYRLFAFIEGSHTYDTKQKRQQAYEAAKQF